MNLYYLLFFVSILVTGAAQLFVSINYRKFSRIKNNKDISGVEVAQNILKSNGLTDVYVVETKGFLSDHFDPNQNVVRLSSEVYHGTSISACAIAAHEVGHAIQHKEGNFFMKLRKFIFPVVNLSSKFGYIAILIGFLLGLAQLIYLGIFMLFVILLFELVTLPVEFDASKRAIENLEKNQILLSDERNGAKQVLTAAALTYVASLVTTLIEIARLIIIVGNDD